MDRVRLRKQFRAACVSELSMLGTGHIPEDEELVAPIRASDIEEGRLILKSKREADLEELAAILVEIYVFGNYAAE